MSSLTYYLYLQNRYVLCDFKATIDTVIFMSSLTYYLYLQNKYVLCDFKATIDTVIVFHTLSTYRTILFFFSFLIVMLIF